MRWLRFNNNDKDKVLKDTPPMSIQAQIKVPVTSMRGRTSKGGVFVKLNGVTFPAAEV